MDRITVVEKIVNDMLLAIEDQNIKTKGFSHIFGVAKLSVLLAIKRNEDQELACIAGLLHDYYAYKALDRHNHAIKGALMAADILAKTNLFTKEEITKVYSSISHHSDKDIEHNTFTEILKDADVLEHYLANPLKDIPEREKARLNKVIQELK